MKEGEKKELCKDCACDQRTETANQLTFTGTNTRSSVSIVDLEQVNVSRRCDVRFETILAK